MDSGTQSGPSSTQNDCFSQTSKSMSTSSQYVQSNMDQQLFMSKVEETIQYILFCCLAEKRALIRRTDINKHVLKEHTRAFIAIMKVVKKRLNNVFGMDLIDIDGKQERFGIKNKFNTDADHSKYAIQATSRTMAEKPTANVNCELNEELDQAVKYSLLMISLSLIFMNNNEIDANQFWDHMKRVDINRSEKRHPLVGDVEKYFTNELVKDGYLEYDQVKGVEPVTYKFKWGYRAKLEISKKSVLDFVCRVYGGSDVCKPEDWNIQYEDAKREDSDENNDHLNDENMNPTQNYASANA